MRSSYSQLLSSLYSEQQESIRDPLWNDIHLSQAMKRILLTPSVQKLARIKQLGPTFLLYPGAVHTRLNHSLGVYHVSFMLLSSFLRQAIEGSCTPNFTEEGMRTFLCASLLHDIGHFPFAHSLKELPLASHEHIASQLMLEDKSLCDAIDKAHLDPFLVGSIIDDRDAVDSKELNFYRKLLSGTLDPDKLDYLSRDAYFCGVPYGVQDVSYITGHMTIRDEQVALQEQALGSVEHVLFSKYLMYRNVYWHQTTRSATAMIKKAVYTALTDGYLKAEQLYALDDEQFFLLPTKKAFPSSDLFLQVRENRLYCVGYEKPYEETGVLEQQTKDLSKRRIFEETLVSRLSAYDLDADSIIVDIPEPISFETDIPIIDKDGIVHPFSSLDQVFSHDIGKVFTKSLRKFRIFTHPSVPHEALVRALEL